MKKTGAVDEDDLMLEVIEAGAEDFNVEDEYFEILTGPGEYSAIRETLETKGYVFIQAGLEMVPQTTVKLTDVKQIEQMEKLIDNLEDLDDVQNVYHNWEID